VQVEPLTHLGSFLGLYRPYIWTVVVYAAFAGLLTLATPIAVQALVSTAAFGTVLQPIAVLVLLLLLGLVFLGVLKALKAWVVEGLQRRMFLDAVSRLTYLLPRLDKSSDEFLGLANPTHRFFEVFSIQKSMASLLVGGVDVVLTTAVGLTVLAFYHPMLLAFDALLLIAIFVIVFGLGRGGVPSALHESSAKYATADLLVEVSRAQYTFGHAAGEEYARARLDALAGSYLQARSNHFRVVMRQIIGALITQAIASAALLGVGGYLVVERELTLGQLVASEIIVTMVVGALSDLGKHVETYYDLVTSVYKLDGLLELPTESDAGVGLPAEASGPAEIKISDLSLSIHGRPLFSEASLTLERGARVVLLGPGESGKSTLLALMFGLRRADRGLIQLDGVDLRELSSHALRGRVAIVAGPELVPGTALDNVLLGRTDIPVGRVRALLEELGLTDELGRLPNGLDTVLGPGGGAPLAHSQALRLTLARAMIGEPGLLAIDADLNAMDGQNRARALAALTHPGAPWTLLLVGDVAGAGELHGVRVVQLESGRFVEQGKAT